MCCIPRTSQTKLMLYCPCYRDIFSETNFINIRDPQRSSLLGHNTHATKRATDYSAEVLGKTDQSLPALSVVHLDRNRVIIFV